MKLVDLDAVMNIVEGNRADFNKSETEILSLPIHKPVASGEFVPQKNCIGINCRYVRCRSKRCLELRNNHHDSLHTDNGESLAELCIKREGGNSGFHVHQWEDVFWSIEFSAKVFKGKTYSEAESKAREYLSGLPDAK